MEDNFYDLLEDYLNEQEIEAKKSLDAKEDFVQTNKNSNSPFTLEDTITINDYVNNFLMIKADASNLMHCGIKDLNCPYVVGIANDYANKNPELVKKGYLLLVVDCHKKRGTYLNPIYLRQILSKDDIERSYKLFMKQRITDLNRLNELFNEYLILKNRIDTNSAFYEILEKQKKLGKIRGVKKYEGMGESYDQHKRK